MRLPILVPSLLLLAAGSAQAVEFAGVEVHGFYSQGYVSSSDNTWLADGSDEGSWDLNEAAVNASYNVTDRLRLTGQIFASNMWGSNQAVNGGSFDQTKVAKVNLDYLYAQYTFNDVIGIRAGRVKQAYGFYNEIRDVDAARSTAVLAQSVYDNRDRETNFLVTGVAGFGAFNLGPAGSLDWQAFWGTTNIPIDGTIANQYSSPDLQLDDLTVDAIVGGQLLWNTPWEGLRLGLSYRQNQGTHADATIPAGVFAPFPLPLAVDIDTTDAWLASIEYLVGDWTFQGEYQRKKLEQQLSGVFNSTNSSESEGYYILASNRFHEQVEAGGILSMYSANWNDRNQEDWNTYQHDIGVFVRYDVNSWWMLKAEAHYVHGAGLLNFQDQQAGYLPPLDSTVLSTEYWTYFVARTTFSF